MDTDTDVPQQTPQQNPPQQPAQQPSPQQNPQRTPQPTPSGHTPQQTPQGSSAGPLGLADEGIEDELEESEETEIETETPAPKRKGTRSSGTGEASGAKAGSRKAEKDTQAANAAFTCLVNAYGVLLFCQRRPVALNSMKKVYGLFRAKITSRSAPILALNSSFINNVLSPNNNHKCSWPLNSGYDVHQLLQDLDEHLPRILQMIGNMYPADSNKQSECTLACLKEKAAAVNVENDFTNLGIKYADDDTTAKPDQEATGALAVRDMGKGFSTWATIAGVSPMALTTLNFEIRDDMAEWEKLGNVYSPP